MFSISKAVTWWKDLQPQKHHLGLHIALASAGITAFCNFLGFSVGTDIAWASVPITFWLLLLFETKRQMHTVATEEPFPIDVYIDGDAVGFITSHEFYLWWMSHLWSPGVHYRQAAILIRALYFLANRILLSLPMALFLIAGLLFLVAPQQFHAVLTELLRYPAGKVQTLNDFLAGAVGFSFLGNLVAFIVSPKSFHLESSFRQSV